MTNKKINNFEEILSVLKLCSDDFYDKALITEEKLTELALKFSKFAEFVVFYDQNNVLGFVSYYNNDRVNKTSFISMIIVRGCYQGKKIGSQILNYVIEDCKDNKMEFLRLEVNRSNRKAVGFYLKNNFIKEKEATDKTDYYILDVKKDG